VVSDNNLQVHVGTRRRLFGHDAIATVHRHGYQFTLEPDIASESSDLIGREALLSEVRQRLAKGARCFTRRCRSRFALASSRWR
jgi:DNA-binding winged helix-turn-helix (wHTH) protein